ncbi:MAG: hypothetical protein J6X44_01765 [Thermoguttaceae bacterium]|nr:hypothetical protein [Thermoguttaceae bacterium]
MKSERRVNRRHPGLCSPGFLFVFHSSKLKSKTLAFGSLPTVTLNGVVLGSLNFSGVRSSYVVLFEYVPFLATRS